MYVHMIWSYVWIKKKVLMFSKNPQLWCNKLLHTWQWNMFLLPSPINCHTVAQVHIHLSSEHLTHGTKPLSGVKHSLYYRLPTFGQQCAALQRSRDPLLITPLHLSGEIHVALYCSDLFIEAPGEQKEHWTAEWKSTAELGEREINTLANWVERHLLH